MAAILTKRNKSYWFIIGLIAVGLMAYMALPFVDVILYGLFIYYVTRPGYKAINARLKSRNVSAILALCVLILPVIIILGYATTVAAYELTNFLRGIDYTIPSEYLNQVIVILSGLGSQLTPAELWDLITSNADLTNILTVPIASIVNIVFKLFFTFIIAFYLLKDGSSLRKWFTEASTGMDNELSNKFMNSVDKDLNRIFFGNILVAILTAALAITMFYCLNYFAPAPQLIVPYPFLIGLICGIAIFVPAIGIKIILAPLYLYIIAQAYLAGVLLGSILFILISVVLVFLIVDISPDMVLRPIVSSRDINAGLLILAYMFGVIVFGFKGLFLGPMILVFALNFMRYVMPELFK